MADNESAAMDEHQWQYLDGEKGWTYCNWNGRIGAMVAGFPVRHISRSGTDRSDTSRVSPDLPPDKLDGMYDRTGEKAALPRTHADSDPELTALIEASRKREPMTNAELQAQRESWVRGELAIGNDRDEVKARQVATCSTSATPEPDWRAIAQAFDKAAGRTNLGLLPPDVATDIYQAQLRYEEAKNAER